MKMATISLLSTAPVAGPSLFDDSWSDIATAPRNGTWMISASSTGNTSEHRASLARQEQGMPQAFGVSATAAHFASKTSA
jgi:hypothetical protein